MSTGQAVTAPPRELRAPRLAVAALFFTNAAVFASVVPRFPDIKHGLGLSNAALGTAIAAGQLGSLIAVLAATPLLVRWASARVAVGCSVVMAANLTLVALAPTWALLAAALFVAASADSIGDIANNAHGLRVQRRYGRSIVNSLHGVWSVGAVTGGLAGAVAAGLDVPVAVHLPLAGLACATVALTARRALLPGDDGAEREPHQRSPDRGGGLRAAGSGSLGLLFLLGLVMAMSCLIEDTGASWSAVYLTDSLHAAPAVAGLAFVALQSLQAVGRLAGDRAVTRFGDRAVARAGGALAALGMGAALAVPTTAATIAGFGLAGLGIATLIPAAMHAADAVPGLPNGAGLSITGFIGRLSLLLSPPAVGIAADAYGLRAALTVVPVAGLLVVLAAAALRPRPRPASGDPG